jgi:hypothetical protein
MKTTENRMVLQVALAVGLLIVLGQCSLSRLAVPRTDCLDLLLSKIGGSDQERAWIKHELGPIREDRLISIVTSPEWGSLTIRQRWLEGDTVRCQQVRKKTDGVQRNECYSICDSGAVKMFEALYEQAAQGLAYRSPNWRDSSNPSSVYIITTGKRCGLTIDEGGDSSLIISEVERWHEMQNAGEPIEDGDLAFAYFSRDAFPSFASYVDLGLNYFDSLCEIAHEANQGKSKRANKVSG